jgi:hypothetical protein
VASHNRAITKAQIGWTGLADAYPGERGCEELLPPLSKYCEGPNRSQLHQLGTDELPILSFHSFYGTDELDELNHFTFDLGYSDGSSDRGAKIKKR